MDHGHLTGRLQDLQKLKLDSAQVLRALDGDAGVHQVMKETGLSSDDIGRQTRDFVRVVSGAWTQVHVPRVSSDSQELCW